MSRKAPNREGGGDFHKGLGGLDIRRWLHLMHFGASQPHDNAYLLEFRVARES
jgi:hypothetical protein